MMAIKQIFFFADVDDIRPIFEEIEIMDSVHYFQTGLFDRDEPSEYESIFELPNLGCVSNGDWNQNPSYIIMPRSEIVKVRMIPQKSGGIKYAIDQLQNPSSCVIKPGGIFNDNILVGGTVGSVSSSGFSTQLIKAFSSLFKVRFKKVGQFYVGNGARAKLQNGWRLVTNSKSPVEYDLKE